MIQQDQELDLDALVRVQTVKVKGKSHQVNPLSAIATKLAGSLSGETSLDRIDTMIRVCNMVAPTLSEEELGQLAIPQLEAIIETSASGLEAVKASDPNVERPATTIPA